MFCRCQLLKYPSREARVILGNQRRYKNKKDHWATIAKKKEPKHLALQHFDDFYSKVFTKSWPSIRLGLLTESKYCAIVNNFSDVDRITSDLENLGAINLKTIYDVYADKGRRKKLVEDKDIERTLEDIKADKVEEDISFLYKSDTQPEVLDTGGAVLQTEKREQSLDETRFIKSASDLSALQEFIPANKLVGMEDWVPESQHYSYYSSSASFPINFVEENKLNFPPNLLCYTYDMGNVSLFPSPKKGTTSVSEYYLMDGASILPVLALDLQPGDCFLDMCAAPGGKSLVAIQTLHPATVVCNDISESRLTRIRRVMTEFLYDFDEKESNNEIQLWQNDGKRITETYFDKILVDVPCTTDRHSVMESNNNIFKPSRIKERIKIPEIQSALLTNALKLVKPGGCVVYSTCSLSPIQNDGVVHMALRKIWEETDCKLSVIDLTNAMFGFDHVFKVGRSLGLKYGQLILPYLPANFGPMYFCKIVKEK